MANCDCKVSFWPGCPPTTSVMQSLTCAFTLGDQERALFDSVAQELNKIAGTSCDFYAQDVQASSRDPLYDEPKSIKWNGPYRITAYAENPTKAPQALEHGLKTEWDGSMWIARKDFEDFQIRYPVIGDVVRFWKLPWINQVAVDHAEVPGAGFFFDVINVDEDGRMFDTASFVGFKVTLHRATDFTPERRINFI